jgi:ABC-type dipeptide/oligopeptide/nickel transport system permease subunit
MSNINIPIHNPDVKSYHLMRLKLWLDGWREFMRKVKKNPAAVIGGIMVLCFLLLAVIGPAIVPHDPVRDNLVDKFAPPFWMEGGSTKYLLGTDQLGMDIFSRIVAGTRISLVIGLLTVGISLTIGTVLGLVSGFYRGPLDSFISRFADLLLAFPWLIFAIGMMSAIGPGFGNLIFALTFKGWVGFFRLVRGEVLSEKTKEYVEAAQALGQSNINIMLREILPNVLNSIMVLGTLRIGFMIIMEASLSFLGLGIQHPEPAWGSMVNDGRRFILNAWWISTFPGIAILVLVLNINLLGEGLRDILDPRLREIE